MGEKYNIKKRSKKVRIFLIITLIIGVGLFLYLIYLFFNQDIKSDSNEITTINKNNNKIENGIHLRTGFVDSEGLMTVVNNCTNCHSSQLILQNRMNKERWNATIKWMQETQNLWDLGANQEIIVNYLVNNYPPVETGGRRNNLANIEWYELKK